MSNFTILDDVVSLRLQMEKFVRHVQNQDATILELQQKTRILEQRQIQQECLDDPLSTLKDGFSTDLPNSKRKRVYSDPRSEEFSMVDQLNCITREQTTNAEQPHYKYYSTEDKSKEANARDEKLLQANRVSAAHKAKSNQNDIRLDKNKYTTAKVVDQETSSNCSNHEASYYQVVAKETSATPSNLEASHYQNKISTRPSATKHHRGTTNWSTANSMMVGTTVFLQSWKNQNKSVALATIVSCDPTQKLDGVQLGKEFWMVHVSIAIVDDEPLIRPYKGYKVIGDIEGVTIAWPSTFIKKINA